MSVKLEGQPGTVRCPFCSLNVSRLYLHRHVSVFHFKFFRFKCRSCEEKFTDQDEVDKHSQTYGHTEEPEDMGLEFPYLLSIINRVTADWMYLTDSTNLDDQKLRLAEISHRMANPPSNSSDPNSVSKTDTLLKENSADVSSTRIIFHMPSENDIEDKPQMAGFIEPPPISDRHINGSPVSLGDSRKNKTKRDFSIFGMPKEIVESLPGEKERMNESSAAKLIANQLGCPSHAEPTFSSNKTKVRGKRLVEFLCAKTNRFKTKRHSWKNAKSIPCGFCNRQVKNEVFPSLFLHGWNHVNFSPFTCSLCGFGTLSEDLVHQHIAEFHSENNTAKIRLPSAFQISEFCSQWRGAFNCNGDLDRVNVRPDHSLYAVVAKMKSFRKNTRTCGKCQKQVTIRRKYVSNSELVQHAMSHRKLPEFCRCEVCDFRTSGTNRLIEHCKKEHNGEGSPSMELMAEREWIFNRCYDPDQMAVNAEVSGSHDPSLVKIKKIKTERRETVETPYSELRSTSIFKWNPASTKPFCKCLMCPKLKTFRRIDLNSLIDHAWSHTFLLPFSCNRCDFAALRPQLVETHIQQEHNNEATVNLPTTFHWSEFDNRFNRCFRLYFPPANEWPHDCYLYPLIQELLSFVIPLPTDECSVCRIRPRIDNHNVTVSHRVKVIHVYRNHVGFSYGCSHNCGYRTCLKYKIVRHLKTDHGGIGSVVGPSEELQHQMRRQFEICFSPKHKAQLDAREDVAEVKCQVCEDSVTVKLTSDFRTTHLWEKHIKTKPFGCSGCGFKTTILAGAKHHVTKMHKKKKETVVPPTPAVIEEFVQVFQSCFSCDPPAKILNILNYDNSHDISHSEENATDDQISLSAESTEQHTTSAAPVSYDTHETILKKISQLSQPCVVVLTQLPTAKRSSRTSAAYLSFRRRAYRTTKAKTISSQDQALIDNHPRSRSVVSVMQRVGSEKKSRVITKNQYRIKKRITRSSGPHLESIKSEFFDETLRPSGIESPKRQKIVMIPNVESTIANRSCSANGNDIRCGALCQCDEQTKSDETATSFWPKRNSIQFSPTCSCHSSSLIPDKCAETKANEIPLNVDRLEKGFESMITSGNHSSSQISESLSSFSNIPVVIRNVNSCDDVEKGIARVEIPRSSSDESMPMLKQQ